MIVMAITFLRTDKTDIAFHRLLILGKRYRLIVCLDAHISIEKHQTQPNIFCKTLFNCMSHTQFTSSLSPRCMREALRKEAADLSDQFLFLWPSAPGRILQSPISLSGSSPHRDSCLQIPPPPHPFSDTSCNRSSVNCSLDNKWSHVEHFKTC